MKSTLSPNIDVITFISCKWWIAEECRKNKHSNKKEKIFQVEKCKSVFSTADVLTSICSSLYTAPLQKTEI